MELSFLGGATTVTGSQYLLDTGDARVLIDCGMFQGSPNETVRNRLPFAYDPREIDALLLTHAHLDHCGLIPHLVASGFDGLIHSTSGTVELGGLVLLDSAKLQTEFAKRAVRRERHHHHLPRDAEADLRAAGPEVTIEIDEPLYTEAETLAALRHFKATDYDTEFEVAKGVTARFVDAGHILGSAIIIVRAAGRTIVFSGDLGRRHTAIIRDPTVLTDADYVLIESTYGGREHEPEAQAVQLLAETVNAVHDAGGVLLVPSFAVGRTQDMVWELDQLLASQRIPHLPLFLDSPMASKATDIYRRHADILRSEFWKLRTVRTTWWALAAAVVANVAVAVLLAIFLPSHMSLSQKAAKQLATDAPPAVRRRQRDVESLDVLGRAPHVQTAGAPAIDQDGLVGGRGKVLGRAPAPHPI